MFSKFPLTIFFDCFTRVWGFHSHSCTDFSSRLISYFGFYLKTFHVCFYDFDFDSLFLLYFIQLHIGLSTLHPIKNRQKAAWSPVELVTFIIDFIRTLDGVAVWKFVMHSLDHKNDKIDSVASSPRLSMVKYRKHWLR